MPISRYILALAMFAAVLAVSAGPARAQTEVIDEIVAVVEEDVILRSELEQAIANITQQVRGRGEQLPPRNVMEEQVLERLIMQELQVQRAEATGIRASDSDVDQALSRVAQQNNISVDQLRGTLVAEGYEFSEFREQIRDELLTSRLQQRVSQSMDPVSETEIDILLASERFGGGEYNISQIVIGLPETATPDQVAEARERIEDVHDRLENGMDFASAAITYSEGGEALEGGTVGWRNVNTMPTLYAEALEKLDPGEYTEPLRTPVGFTILKLNDQRDSREVIVQEYKARHIMVRPSELVTEENAVEQIQNLHERITADGEDFANLAREYSDDESSANIGGLLNWFPRGAYGQRIQEVLDGLEPGEVSEPFQTSQGWHIIKLLETREADRTDEAIRGEAREMLRRQKAQEEVDKFMRQLREESYVDIRL